MITVNLDLQFRNPVMKSLGITSAVGNGNINSGLDASGKHIGTYMYGRAVPL